MTAQHRTSLRKSSSGDWPAYPATVLGAGAMLVIVESDIATRLYDMNSWTSRLKLWYAGEPRADFFFVLGRRACAVLLSMSDDLRKYQMEALGECRVAYKSGIKRVLLVMPTGAGKTFTTAHIIRRLVSKGKRCIFVAHRNELIEQCSNRLKSFGVEHGFIKGGIKERLYKPVQVATIQALNRRNTWYADFVFFDEAHRSCSRSYKKFISEQPDIRILGLTATPYRMDGRGLGEIYEKLVEVTNVQELIDEGSLIEPTVFAAEKVDLSEVGLVGGDYSGSGAAAALQNTVLRGDIIKNWFDHCGSAIGASSIEEVDAATIVFAPNVEQGRVISKQFSDAGVSAAFVDYTTKKKDRREIFKKFERREIVVLVNVGICTEGYDLPHLECVQIVRPTRSKSLAFQMCGRIMRPDDNKRFAYILDHANCVRMHGFVTDPQEFSLSGREKRPRKNSADQKFRECPQCGAALPITRKMCHECGYNFPKKDFEFTDEKLIALNPSNIDPIDLAKRQEDFNTWCAKCESNGYKPNWAKVQFQRVYGVWPCANVGIKYPRFFFAYEKAYQRRLRERANEQS